MPGPFICIDTTFKVDKISMSQKDFEDFKEGSLTPVDFDCLKIFLTNKEVLKTIADLSAALVSQK